MEAANFLGHECSLLQNDTLTLMVARSFGPRILFFGLKGKENLFAELPDLGVECPGKGVFHFYGGHRLWHAPEEPVHTYLPDDFPVDIFPTKDGLSVTQKEGQGGMQKSMEICLSGYPRRVVITHRLTNRGLEDVTCAPWAITQLKPGGVAILPQTREDTGLLPNRLLALWSYADMSNPNLYWGRNYILLQANMDAPFKVGFPNPRGWLAYWSNGMLFVKHAAYDARAGYFDFGSSSECYCNDQFLELETLAPKGTLAPGETATHTEVWDLYEDVGRPQSEHEVGLLIEKLGLE